MLIGHKDIEERFKRAARTGNLSHAYLFFGPQQVGKHTFALHFANLLENDTFDSPAKFLNECLVVKPVIEDTSESIGIDAVRELKKFLYDLPVNSKYRIGIIDNAEYLTTEAQNALLKIAEEPPAHAILIINASNPDVLIRPLQSRLQKVYFSSVKKELISKMLCSEHALTPAKADEIASLSFGQPGFAIDLIKNEDVIRTKKEVEMVIKNPSNWKKIVGELVNIENKAKSLPATSSPDSKLLLRRRSAQISSTTSVGTFDSLTSRSKIEMFLKVLMASLGADPKGNYAELASVGHRLTMMKDWNTNKRLQLEAIKL